MANAPKTQLIIISCTVNATKHNLISVSKLSVAI